MVSIAKRNSHAALAWAKQRHQQIQKAKEMKEHRLGNLKKFKENQSLNNISNNDNDIQVKQTNSNLQNHQRVPTPCVRKIISGRRKGNVVVTNTSDHILLSKIEEEEEECDHQQQLDKNQKNNVREMGPVIKYGRRKTVNNDDTTTIDELDIIKEKIKKTKENLVLEKRAFLPRWALEDDLLNKVREKLDAKINMLYGSSTNEIMENNKNEEDKSHVNNKGISIKDRTEQIQRLKKLTSSRRVRRMAMAMDNNNAISNTNVTENNTNPVQITNNRYKKLTELKRKNKSQISHPVVQSIDNSENDISKDDSYKEPTYKCGTCGRKFIKSSYDKHSQICVNVFKRKRKVFNSSVARTSGNVRCQQNDSSKGLEKNKTKLNSTWKQKSQELRLAICSSLN